MPYAASKNLLWGQGTNQPIKEFKRRKKMEMYWVWTHKGMKHLQKYRLENQVIL